MKRKRDAEQDEASLLLPPPHSWHNQMTQRSLHMIFPPVEITSLIMAYAGHILGHWTQNIELSVAGNARQLAADAWGDHIYVISWADSLFRLSCFDMSGHLIRRVSFANYQRGTKRVVRVDSAHICVATIGKEVQVILMDRRAFLCLDRKLDVMKWEKAMLLRDMSLVLDTFDICLSPGRINFLFQIDDADSSTVISYCERSNVGALATLYDKYRSSIPGIYSMWMDANLQEVMFSTSNMDVNSDTGFWLTARASSCRAIGFGSQFFEVADPACEYTRGEKPFPNHLVVSCGSYLEEDQYWWPLFRLSPVVTSNHQSKNWKPIALACTQRAASGISALLVFDTRQKDDVLTVQVFE